MQVNRKIGRKQPRENQHRANKAEKYSTDAYTQASRSACVAAPTLPGRIVQTAFQLPPQRVSGSYLKIDGLFKRIPNRIVVRLLPELPNRVRAPSPGKMTIHDIGHLERVALTTAQMRRITGNPRVHTVSRIHHRPYGNGSQLR
ncbi:hypothetical protein GCM10023192_08310 [Amycolatopsis samaneae]